MSVHTSQFVAHRVNRLHLVERVRANPQINWVEVDVQFLRGLDFWRERLRARHGRIPLIHPAPTYTYPSITQIADRLPQHVGIALDLKYYFDFWISSSIEKLLQRFITDGREHIALTGGRIGLMQRLAKKYPELDVWFTVSNVGNLRHLTEYRKEIRSVSVRDAVLRKVGLGPFEGINVYVWGIPQGKEQEWIQKGVSGVIIDRF